MAKGFHTPLQTPKGPDMQHPEGARAKKKKKSKKKAKNAEAVSGQESGEAFHEQLSQVTDTQSGYYALRGSSVPPQEALRRSDDKVCISVVFFTERSAEQNARNQRASSGKCRRT